MRKISAVGKSFTMGAPNEQVGQAYEGANYRFYEYPHIVSFTNDFYTAVFPTTAHQHKLICNQSADASDTTLRKPAGDVLWTDLRGYFVNNGVLGWWPDAGVWSSDGFVANPSGSPHDVDSTKPC